MLGLKLNHVSKRGHWGHASVLIRPSHQLFCFRHATPSHYHHYADLLTCIWHLQWNISNACLNACWVYSEESVYKVSQLPSLFSTKKMWVCICLTDPLKFRWSRGCAYNSSYYHRQIGSINLSHCCHIFLWRCAWGGCTIVVPSYTVGSIIYPGRKSGFCVFYYRAVLWCAQIMECIFARWSYLFVCTSHHFIVIVTQTDLKVLNF